MVEELRLLFRDSGTAGEIELYPGVHHGFAFPQVWCYWERLISLYRRRLGCARGHQSYRPGLAWTAVSFSEGRAGCWARRVDVAWQENLNQPSCLPTISSRKIG